jgi:hypothetical protein
MRRGGGLTDLKAGYKRSQMAEMVVVFRGMADTSCYGISFAPYIPSNHRNRRRNWWNYVRKIYLVKR